MVNLKVEEIWKKPVNINFILTIFAYMLNSNKKLIKMRVNLQ